MSQDAVNVGEYRQRERERERERESVARALLAELRASRLFVIKFRTPEGGYNRASISQNPPWYQAFCAAYVRGRRRYPKPRTIIKRINTIRALERIIGGCREGIYIERLLAVIDEEAEFRREVETTETIDCGPLWSSAF